MRNDVRRLGESTPRRSSSATTAVSDDEKLIDLSTTTRVHVVGIGGAGMSAIASVLAAMGHRVTGSDLKESPKSQTAPLT